jgi:hypothetical protein
VHIAYVITYDMACEMELLQQDTGQRREDLAVNTVITVNRCGIREAGFAGSNDQFW